MTNRSTDRRRPTDRRAAPDPTAPTADLDLNRLRDRAYLALVPVVLDVAYAVLVLRRYRRARAARRARDRRP